MASNFGDYMHALLFAPLRKVQKSINQWAIFFSVIGKLFDATKQDVFRVRSESMIASAREPVLEMHGLDRGMVRLKGEMVNNYRIRLAMKSIIASEAGTNKAILYVAKAFGYDNVSIERNPNPEKWAEATVQFIGGKIVLDDQTLLLKELNKIKPAGALLTVSKEQRYSAAVYQGAVRVIGRQMTIRQV
ncbi:hypothetical protein [Oscillibacter sp.]|uniref:hypothetical protein n=1 Tax=Oscillibacter sp. TaxID=1945593 RepID=UPI0028A70B6B|nr:hypothetical protein [Oscillibacter sp.]